jgi:hypothetical protein
MESIQASDIAAPIFNSSVRACQIQEKKNEGKKKKNVVPLILCAVDVFSNKNEHE